MNSTMEDIETQGCANQREGTRTQAQGTQHQWWPYSCLLSPQSTQEFILNSRPWPLGTKCHFSYLYGGCQGAQRSPGNSTLLHHRSPVLPRVSKWCCDPQHLAASTHIPGMPQPSDSQQSPKQTQQPFLVNNFCFFPGKG